MGNSNAKGDAVLAELAELKVDLASHLKSLAQIQQRIDKLSAETSPKNDTRIAALIAAEIATISKAIGTSSSQASAEHAPLIINAKAAPVATVAKLTSGEKPLINWVIGPPDNAGWAYGNNARRLAREMPGYRHEISTSERAAVAVYFDAIVAERYTVPADKSILRIGGPRPLDRLFGDDEDKARAGLARFDAIVALSLNLFLRVSKVHPRTYFIPNALDLEEWRPERRVRPKGRPFTVGFAASLKSSKEIEVKGFEIARAGAEKAGVEFVYVEKKEGKQIAHDRMIEDFYSRCDVLAHPAAPGREGTSNVIMEALSCGVPVVTTVDAGLHGETLVDRRSGLIRPRSADAYAEAFTLLKNDRKMLQRISLAGRQYCERNHDIRQAASEYQAIIDSLTSGTPDVVAPPSTCFVPFWMPAQNFGSSRLRALYPFEFLVRGQYPSVSLGYNPDAQVAIVVQSCDEPIWESINKNKQQFVIYDVCDRYFENSKVFKRPTGDVNSLDRYNQLMERADLVIVPSRELKVEISSRHPHKPVIYVPETIDYGSTRLPVRPEGDRVVLWFGNPDRGNFESSMWMLQHVRDHYGYEPLIVSRASFFKKYPEFAPHVVNWSPEAMAAAFERANLCVLSHAQEERTKSPNRFISAIMRGIPTLVSGSPACEEILTDAGMTFAIIDGPRQLNKAMAKLADPQRRQPFVSKLQRRFRDSYGEAAIGRLYTELLTNRTYAKAAGGKRNVALITHNLSLGEGAPWSLFELAQGLAGREDMNVFIYSAATGPLKSAYEKAGLSLEIFDETFLHCVKALNKRYVDSREHFLNFLSAHNIDAVICNTIKSAPYANFAEANGVPAMVIVRESFSAGDRFSVFESEARVAGEVGLARASKIVFVANESRKAWNDQQFMGDVHTIPNGISPRRFEAVMSRPKDDVRAELGLPKNDVIALCVGTINKRKGQEDIVNAFAKLPEDVLSRSRVVFLGGVDGSYLDTFVGLIDALPENVRSRIHVVRAIADVGPWYRVSDFFLMNSSSEAYPRSVVEALLFGLPILSTKVFGVLEQVRPNENGFLYDFNAMDDWQSHFIRLVTDDDLRARMSVMAARSFWKLTTHAEMLHCYCSLLAQLQRKAQAPALVQLKAAE